MKIKALTGLLIVALAGCNERSGNSKLFEYTVKYIPDGNSGNIVIDVKNLDSERICGSIYEISSLAINYVSNGSKEDKLQKRANDFSYNDGIFVLESGKKRKIVLSTYDYDSTSPRKSFRSGIFKMAKCKTIFTSHPDVQKIKFMCNGQSCSSSLE